MKKQISYELLKQKAVYSWAIARRTSRSPIEPCGQIKERRYTLLRVYREGKWLSHWDTYAKDIHVYVGDVIAEFFLEEEYPYVWWLVVGYVEDELKLLPIYAEREAGGWRLRLASFGVVEDLEVVDFN